MKLIRESLFEKFEENSDPIKDMGIGRIDFKEEYNEQYVEGIKSNDPGWRRWHEREGDKWTMTYVSNFSY